MYRLALIADRTDTTPQFTATILLCMFKALIGIFFIMIMFHYKFIEPLRDFPHLTVVAIAVGLTVLGVSYSYFRWNNRYAAIIEKYSGQEYGYQNRVVDAALVCIILVIIVFALLSDA